MKKISMWLVVIPAVLALHPPPAGSQPYGLPKTGQYAVYHPAAPRDLGDDGAVRAGYPLGSRRDLAFSGNGDGTVTDGATGLMWQKKDSGGQEFGSRSGMLTWEDAFAYVAAMNQQYYGGHSDWRVPNLKELLSSVAQVRCFRVPFPVRLRALPDGLDVHDPVHG
jgi:hypothetical protein